MSGPPSWVGDEIEDGDEDDSSSLTYYEKKFGQIGDDDGAFDPDTFTPNYTDTDIGDTIIDDLVHCVAPNTPA